MTVTTARSTTSLGRFLKAVIIAIILMLAGMVGLAILAEIVDPAPYGH